MYNYSSHIASSGDMATNPLPPQMDMSVVTRLIENFDRMRLIELQEDEANFNEFIQDLQQVKNIQPQKESIEASNQSLAQHNLSLKPNYEQFKGELTAVYEELKSVREGAIETQTQLASMNSQQQSPDVLLALLQTETAKTEEQAEATADSFFANSIGIQEFLDDFITQRTLFHSRTFKVGKLKELLQPQQTHQLPPTSHLPSWYQPNPPPYPTM